MSGRRDMVDGDRWTRSNAYNHNFLTGCGLLAAAAMLGFVILVAWIINADRRAAQYPGSVPVASHSKYRLPHYYRWDDAYHTSDPFPAVYNWYSTVFDLGAEAKALERCILLEGTRRGRFRIALTAERQMTVSLCDTPDGRAIFVTRSTSLR